MLHRILNMAGLGLLILVACAKAKDEQPAKPEKKKGTIIGMVTGKGKNYIEVKAPGEVEARRYTPHWRGGLPKDGGGLDKKMLETFKKLNVGDRIRMEWEFEERPRAVKIEVLKKTKKEKD